MLRNLQNGTLAYRTGTTGTTYVSDFRSNVHYHFTKIDQVGPNILNHGRNVILKNITIVNTIYFIR